VAQAFGVLVPVLGPRASRGAPLGARTTYRVGGPAAVVAEVETSDELVAVGRAAGDAGLPVLVVGNGSNLLVADGGFPGIAVALGASFAGIEIEGTVVKAGGAANLPTVARRSAAAGLRGLEWAVGVPGSVGGAVRMNAGGHGSDMAACLQRCTVVDLGRGTTEVRLTDAMAYGYRHSSIESTQVVTEAWLQGRTGDRQAALGEIDDIVAWRREHQPGGRNAGSVFTNPPGDSAGRLVEASGCKGMRRGTAMVSDKHANFIQSEEGGSADDVWALIAEVADTVARRQGIRLVTEVRTVGFSSPPAAARPCEPLVEGESGGAG
jgi:UDP-N-acetylmuramate dehydrogenase